MSNLQRCRSACFGIEVWLSDKGIKTTTKTVSDITAAFLKQKGLPYQKFNKRYKGLYTADVRNALVVQAHFGNFTNFVIKNYIEKNKNEEV